MALVEPERPQGGMVTRLEERTGKIGAAILVAVAIQATSFFLYAPPFGGVFLHRLVGGVFLHRLHHTYIPLCKDPFTRSPVGEPYVRHRILAPLIAYSIGLRGVSGAAVPVVAITLMLGFLYGLLRRDLPPDHAAMGVFLLGTTLAVITSQTWLGYADSLGHLGVVVCLLLGSILPLAPIMLLAMLSEERAAVAIPLIVFWHFLRESQEVRWRKAAWRCVVLSASFGLWVVCFLAMKRAFAIQWPQGFVVGLPFIKEQLTSIPAGAFYALRGAWILPIMLAAYWWRRRMLMLAAFLAAILLALGPCIGTGDTSRSMAFAFPAVVIALSELHKEDSARCRLLLETALLLNIVTAQYQVVVNHFSLYVPLPLWFIYGRSFF
jgi:hypothetical protein